MGNYKLIDLDRDEKSIVRRALYQESRTGEQAITKIFSGIQQEHGFSKARLIKPRWETSVHPLYFWAYSKCKCEPAQSGNYRACFDHVVQQLASFDGEKLHEAFWYTVVDCEIDILVEDAECFFFVETKIPVGGTAIDWYRGKHGAHQLVHQYLQGKLLKKLAAPEKEFALATVGANNGKPQNIELNETELELLALVDYEGRSLRIPDFPLKLLAG